MLDLAISVGQTQTPEAVLFWVLAPLTVAAALGMLLVKKAVHSAILMASVMVNLAIFYIAQDALFLGIVQIVVYTGAVMMLFLFILMLVGVDSSDSLTETIPGLRPIAITAALGFGGLMMSLISRATLGRNAIGLDAANSLLAKTGRVLLDDVIAREIKDKKRIICENAEWIAFVPYAARYPFEIHIAPKRTVAGMADLDEKQSDLFAPIAKEALTRLDGVFGIEMAYIDSWYQAPVNVGRDSMRLHWQIVSVRRQPGKLKYLSGSESAMGAFIMDLEPEQSAKQLQEVKY